MKPGERIKIRTMDGVKLWGLVTRVDINFATLGAPGEKVQGPGETTLTVVIEGPRD